MNTSHHEGRYFAHYLIALTISSSTTNEKAPAEETSSDTEQCSEVMVDIAGNLRLPRAIVTDLKAHQDLCQDVFMTAYSKFLYFAAL